ncbi:NADH dehydrogenase [ubiquinone] 1 alpha subcomplex subunit 4-like 2 isoform X1 [Ursus arctos]|uniref:NADH dehydrogenase [ubiquinone] 1 alpha subcomplex subunit 4-like 2 isoform X1 n=1 Tax=Ursus arctos TaxID=9644 RepID=UPI001CF88787|nr:NADH dehydrogenase [ubiquinone] 1 alpha subcomplex subunit 4-like 2 isoform X1 [Ursus arctos]
MGGLSRGPQASHLRLHGNSRLEPPPDPGGPGLPSHRSDRPLTPRGPRLDPLWAAAPAPLPARLPWRRARPAGGLRVPPPPRLSAGGVAGWDRKNNPEPWNRLSPNDQYKFLAVSTDYKKLKKDRPDF